MRLARTAHTTGLAITVLFIGSVTEGVVAAADPTVLELRVITYGSLTLADVDLARQTTTDLLARAGLQTLWRECQGDGCAGPAEGRRVAKVLLVPYANRSNPGIAGEVAHAPPTNAPIVLVYVPRNLEVLEGIRLSRAGRTHPALSTLAAGHVVGLTIAHEIGHAFGLGHSQSGLMKAHLYPEDIIHMRQSQLRVPKIRLQDAVNVRQNARYP